MDAFTRYVWAMTSKTTTGFNYVNLIQQVMQIDKQKVIVEYKTYINTNMSKSRTGETNNWINERINGDKNWTIHAKQCVNEYNSTIYLSTLKLVLAKELDFVYTNNKNGSNANANVNIG